MFATYVFSGRKVAKVSAAGQKDTNGEAKGIPIIQIKYEILGCDVWANITLEFEGDGHAKCYYNSKYVSSCSASVTFERGQFVVGLFFCGH
jgi:hypothetical protein